MHNISLVARDRKRGRILRGGLGAMGVGQMWGTAGADDMGAPGFDTLPELDSFGGFGTYDEWHRICESGHVYAQNVNMARCMNHGPMGICPKCSSAMREATDTEYNGAVKED